MTQFEKNFPNANIGEVDMLDDLKVLGEYYDRMGIDNGIMEAREDVILPLLVAAVDDENDESIPPRMIVHTFIPTDKDVAEDGKLLQLYCDITTELSQIDRLSLLEIMNFLNQRSACGTAVMMDDPVNGGEKLGMRTVQIFPVNEAIDPAIFVDLLATFDVSCITVERALAFLMEGKSASETIAALS